MKIYFPYTGPEMPSIVMSQIGRDCGINVDIEYIGRLRLRKAVPGLGGIPHQEYKVRLFPITDQFRKFNASGRRINGVCWHGHWAFMNELLGTWDVASIRSAIAEYYGENDFHVKTGRIHSGDSAFNRNATCKCPDL